MKRVLITGGPTNEYIDEVMKITNMSTGSLTLSLADRAIKKGDEVTIIVTHSVLKSALFADYGFRDGVPGLKVVPIETTEDMYEALKAEAEDFFEDIGMLSIFSPGARRFRHSTATTRSQATSPDFATARSKTIGCWSTRFKTTSSS